MTSVERQQVPESVGEVIAMTRRTRLYFLDSANTSLHGEIVYSSFCGNYFYYWQALPLRRMGKDGKLRLHALQPSFCSIENQLLINYEHMIQQIIIYYLSIFISPCDIAHANGLASASLFIVNHDNAFWLNESSKGTYYYCIVVYRTVEHHQTTFLYIIKVS